jgi:predicted nucleic acid-binding protein
VKGEHVVIDAAALLDLMVATDVGFLLDQRLEGCLLHSPSHIDAEVLGGLERLERAGVLGAYRALDLVGHLARASIERHPLDALLEGAWRYRHEVQMEDALYIELARSRGMTLVTTNPSLARVAHSVADLVATKSDQQ